MSNFFRKINQNLLKKHPLLWNTRFPIALAVTLGLNVLFFAIGFIAFNYPKDLLSYSILSEEQLYIIPSVLTSLLFLIVWIYYYSQNNAFKSNFPVSKSHLTKEFFLILVLMFFNLIYMFSFTFGYRLHGHMDTKNVDLVSKIERANMAMMFLPIEHADYNITGSCDTIFMEKEERVYKMSLVDSMTNRFEDSLRVAYDLDTMDEIEVREWATRRILIKWGMMEDSNLKVSKNSSGNVPYDEADNVVYADNVEYTAAEELDYSAESDYGNRSNTKPIEYSYHYYCQDYFSRPSGAYPIYEDHSLDKKRNSEKGRDWIRNNSKGKIKACIKAYLKDLDDAGAKYNVDVSYWAAAALKDSLLSNKFSTLERIHNYRRDGDYNYKQAIELNAYDQYLDNTYELKEYPYRDFKKVEWYLILLTIALSFTFFIFMFRLNGIKPLLLAIVFGGILSLVVALIAFALDLNDNGSFSLILSNLLAAIVIFAGIYAVQKKKRKLKAGILLQLALVAMLFVPVFIMADIMMLLEPEAVFSALYSIEDAVSITYNQPLYSWLRYNGEFLAKLYPFVIMAIIIFWFIPMSKKLRANPDE